MHVVYCSQGLRRLPWLSHLFHVFLFNSLLDVNASFRTPLLGCDSKIFAAAHDVTHSVVEGAPWFKLES